MLSGRAAVRGPRQRSFRSRGQNKTSLTCDMHSSAGCAARSPVLAGSSSAVRPADPECPTSCGELGSRIGSINYVCNRALFTTHAFFFLGPLVDKLALRMMPPACPCSSFWRLIIMCELIKSCLIKRTLNKRSVTNVPHRVQALLSPYYRASATRHVSFPHQTSRRRLAERAAKGRLVIYAPSSWSYPCPTCQWEVETHLTTVYL